MEDIQYLIDFGIEESIHLDYKASGALDKSETKKKRFQRMFLHLLTPMEELLYME